MRSEIWAVNICMDRCGLMFIFSSSQRLNLIYCLTGFRVFFLFDYREIEMKRGCKWDTVGKRNKGRKQSDCVSYLWGSCQKKPDSESGRNKDKKKKIVVLDGRGGRGSRQMLLIPVVGCWSEGGEIWVMGTESEMSTDWVRAELGPSGRREYQHWLRGTQDFGTVTGLMAKLLDIMCVRAWMCVCVLHGGGCGIGLVCCL